MQRIDRSFAEFPAARIRAYRSLSAFCRQRILRVFVAFWFVFACCASFVNAAEEWSAFLEALKARGYDDVALVYLKQLQASGQAPPELDAELDYRIGEAAFEEAVGATGSRREQLFEEASDAFDKYLKASPDGPSALEATSGLARIQAERGEKLLADAKRKGTPETSQAEKRELAQKAFREANEGFKSARKLSASRLRSMQQSGSARPEELQFAQATYLDLLIRSATVQAQLARTFDPSSDEFKDGLTKAAEAFNDVYTKYQKYSGAFKARLGEAQVYHDLGRDAEALEILSELGVLPLKEEFYALKTRALALYAEIADSTDDPARLMELVQKFYEWSDGEPLPDSYYQSAEGRKIFLLSGKAIVRLEKERRNDFDRYAAAGKKTFVDDNDPVYKLLNVGQKKKATKLLLFAGKTLNAVASGRTPEALEAQELLKDEVFTEVDLSKSSFTQKADDFESASDIATRASATFSEKRQSFLVADESVKSEAERELNESARSALAAIERAIDLSAKATRPDRRARLSEETRVDVASEVNRLLLKEATIAFAVERYEEAFVAGDAVAHAEEFDEASQGAIVALRSLQTMLARARGAGSPEFDALDARVKDYVAYANARWGGDESSPIAQEAIAAELETAASNGDAHGAIEALSKIPEASPRRASLELRLGQAMWAEWTRRNAEQSDGIADDGDDEEDDEVDLDFILELARKSLYDGLERKISSDEGVKSDDASAIYSTYLLAQAYAQQGDFENAEKWLVHPTIGALSVVNRVGTGDGEPAPSFVDENFQIAVLALELRIAASSADRLEDAKKTSARLDALASSSPDASAKLTRVYLSLGKRFEERLSSLKKLADAGDESKRVELDNTMKGFETFLNSVSNREEGNSYASLRWIAESYLSIGKELLGKDGASTPESEDYFAKAIAVCKKLVASIDANPSFAPSADSKTSTLLKVCEILRYQGKYPVAYKNLQGILAKSPNNVDAQWEAASLLEAWGRVDPVNYTKSMAGDSLGDPQSRLVWGWNGLMKRLAPSVGKDEQYRTLYFDACKAKVRTRYKYVQTIKDPEEKKKQAQAAEDEVKRLWQVHPDFNGPDSVKYFDKAYRGFQKLRGVQDPSGLKASGEKQAQKESEP